MRLRPRRSDEIGLPALVKAPSVRQLPKARLQSAGKYIGTATADGAKVTDRGLGVGGGVRISLSDEGLDVIRLAGAYRIPTASLRSAREVQEWDGRPMEPEGALVVRWAHGDHVLDSVFRLEAPRSIKLVSNATIRPPKEVHREWVRTLGKIARQTHE